MNLVELEAKMRQNTNDLSVSSGNATHLHKHLHKSNEDMAAFKRLVSSSRFI